MKHTHSRPFIPLLHTKVPSLSSLKHHSPCCKVTSRSASQDFMQHKVLCEVHSSWPMDPTVRQKNLLHIGPNPLHTAPYPLHIAPNPLHTAPYPLHIAPYPLHIAPYPLHIAPNLLHIAPNFSNIHLNVILSTIFKFHKSVPFSVFKLNFAHIFNFYHS